MKIIWYRKLGYSSEIHRAWRNARNVKMEEKWKTYSRA